MTTQRPPAPPKFFPDSRPTPPNTLAEVLAAIEANPVILDRWLAVTGPQSDASAQHAAESMVRNPKTFYPLLIQEPPEGVPSTKAEVVALIQANPKAAKRWPDPLGYFIERKPALWYLLVVEPLPGEGSGSGDTSKLWPAPIPIKFTANPLPDLQIPALVLPYVNAVVELAGASVGTAHASVMGAINLLVADLIDVQTLAATPRPSALFFFTASETGWRKSTAHDLAFKAHREADREARLRWEKQRDKPEGKGLLPAGMRDIRKVAPVALRSDSTSEAMLKNLSDGRRTQGLITSEAGVMLGGWSFGKAQAGQTLARLNQVWSNEPLNFERSDGRLSFFVEGARLSACLAAQPSFVAEHLLTEAAGNGFSARTLLNRDTARPPEQEFEWTGGTSATYYVERLNNIIGKARRQQDIDVEFSDTPPKPLKVVYPTEGARHALQAFHRESLDQADGDPGPHERGFLERAAEQSSRYAANLAAFRCLAADTDLEDCYTEDDVVAASHVIRWHRQNLTSFAEDSTKSALLDAAVWMQNRLKDITDPLNGTVKVLTYLGQRGAGPAKPFKNDPAAKREIVALLEEYNLIRPVEKARGLHYVNPLNW